MGFMENKGQNKEFLKFIELQIPLLQYNYV